MKDGLIFISNNGESLPIAYRCLMEGTPTEIYVHNPKSRAKNYRNIMPRLDVPGLQRALKKWSTVVFDLTHPNEDTHWDAELLRMVGMKSRTIREGVCEPNSVFGPVADKLRGTHKVIGCSKWSEDIELDRMLGAQIAQQIGLHLPPAEEFKNLKEGLKFLESSEGKRSLWVLKPMNNQDLDLTYVESFEGELADKFKNSLPKRVDEAGFRHMLQEVVEGTEISSEIWWDGSRILNPNRTIEGKKFLCGNRGEQIGSQNNTVWLCKDKDGVVLKEMKQLIPHMKKANYIGPVDANCIISKDGRPYFLEWSARLGYDAIYCLLSLTSRSTKEAKIISSFFLNDFQYPHSMASFSSSSRITIPPFPGKDKAAIRDRATDILIDHDLKWLIKHGFWLEDAYYDESTEHLRTGGRDGIVGVQVAVGPTVEDSAAEVLRRVEALRIGASKQYRVDLGERAVKARSTLKKQGLSID